MLHRYREYTIRIWAEWSVPFVILFPSCSNRHNSINIKNFQTFTAPGLNFWEKGGRIWKFGSSGASLALAFDISYSGFQFENSSIPLYLFNFIPTTFIYKYIKLNSKSEKKNNLKTEDSDRVYIHIHRFYTRVYTDYILEYNQIIC